MCRKGGRLLPLVHDSTFPAGQYEGARPRQSTCHVRTKGSSHRAQCAQPQPLLSAQWEALQSRTAFLLVAGCEGKPSTEPWQKQCAKLLFSGCSCTSCFIHETSMSTVLQNGTEQGSRLANGQMTLKVIPCSVSRISCHYE